ncbi:prostate stem cell antigen-like isoform X3 [Mercenaria mercenaria]|uniref:prostate stem cell antigen-like isoform X3 n=1 Tax=Mercenaria mercenaria TaxID=6596 RepID=UPI00234E9DE6|nr:prostate stem cell antigen-like isoform X3 [Mercenaria mercenaria]
MSQRCASTGYRNCSNIGLLILIGVVNGLLCHKVTIMPIRDDISAPLLTCWTCSHSSDSPNNECVKMNNRQNMTKTECQIYQPFCKIQRFEAGGKVEKLERSCTQKCDPGCHRYESVKRCDFCCTQPLCNVGNDADTRHPVLLTIVSVLVAGVCLLV